MARFSEKPILLPAKFLALQPTIEALQREVLTPIEDSISGNEANVDEDETVTGNWTFSGTVDLSGAVTFTGLVGFSNSAAFSGNVGFYGETPIAQQSTPSTLSMASVSGTGDDATINSNLFAIQGAVNAIKTALDNLGLTA